MAQIGGGSAFHEQLAGIKNPKEGERKLTQLTSASVGGQAEIGLIQEIGEFVELFAAGQISVRQFPCGEEHPELGFVGMLLDRPGSFRRSGRPPLPQGAGPQRTVLKPAVAHARKGQVRVLLLPRTEELPAPKDELHSPTCRRATRRKASRISTRRIQLPEEWVERLTQELEDEIVERQATAAERRVALTKRLAALAEERQKLLRAYYANAIPLELLKSDQDRITEQEEQARAVTTEADLERSQESSASP